MQQQQCVLGDLPLPAARHPVCLPADRWAVQENKIQNTQTQHVSKWPYGHGQLKIMHGLYAWWQTAENKKQGTRQQYLPY